MTEDKKNKIRELRMRGYGYSTIADFISEKRDNVRNYCRKVGLDGTVICGDWYPSIEHIMPISKGGLHSWDNVRLAHRICNTRKGNHMPPGWHTGYITRATG